MDSITYGDAETYLSWVESQQGVIDEMIKVTILAKNYGDKVQTMTIQQFKQQYGQEVNRHRWAIFSEDTANPDNSQQINNINDVQDGQSLTLVPQLAGGQID